MKKYTPHILLSLPILWALFLLCCLLVEIYCDIPIIHDGFEYKGDDLKSVAGWLPVGFVFAVNYLIFLPGFILGVVYTASKRSWMLFAAYVLLGVQWVFI